MGSNLTIYQTTKYKTCPISKHLQSTAKRDLNTEIPFAMVRKHCGKRRKCWLPAFSPFPTMFSKGFFFRVVKSQDFVWYKFKK